MEPVIIFVDAAQNTVRKEVNRFGKLQKFDNGGYRIGVIVNGEASIHFNTKAEDSFAGESFAILKGIEAALEKHPEAKHLIVFTDCIEAASQTRNAKANSYRYLWGKLIQTRDVGVDFYPIGSKGNPADEVSRTEDLSLVDPERIRKLAAQAYRSWQDQQEEDLEMSIL